MAAPAPALPQEDARVAAAALSEAGDVIELHAADGSATARVHRLGATLISWATASGEAQQQTSIKQDSGEAEQQTLEAGTSGEAQQQAFQERLFVSPLASYQAPKAIRGGTPVCFPQFGQLGPLQVGGSVQVTGVAPWENAKNFAR